MIKSIQKIIKVGNSGAITIPAKDMQRQNFAVGDEVEITIRPVRTRASDEQVLAAAKEILDGHRQDFVNLAKGPAMSMEEIGTMLIKRHAKALKRLADR